MEILNPSPPPSPAVGRYGGAGSSAAFRRGIGWGAGAAAEEGAALHVLVGRSPEKTLGLLRWAFRRFGCSEIGLLHVHQPSPVIPTLMGKIPVNQANEELVSSYRRFEKETTKKILLSYLSFCHSAQVHASILVTENGQIQNGIVDLLNQHGIRRLVMGSTSDDCFKLKGSLSKASFMAKNAPPFCEIWFISKSRQIWTREASVGASLSIYSPDGATFRKRPWFNSSNNHNTQSILNSKFIINQACSEPTEHSNSKVIVSTGDTGSMYRTKMLNLQDPTMPVGMEFPLERISKDIVCDHLKGIAEEAERSRKAALVELVKGKELESDVAKAFSKVKVSEAAHAHEMKTRKELENLWATATVQHEEIINQREKAIRELENSQRMIAILNSRAQEVALLTEEAVGELETIKSFIEILKLERENVQRQREEVAGQLESYSFEEIKLSGVQTVSREFSESFKLEQLFLKEESPVPCFFLCPIIQEIMHDPQVASDGFTYEESAVRGWFQNGRETSPVTNLKLKNPNLTPNHALRFAIQDWLCQS